MKLAIMQPYLFPYIGYFQLINAVDKFIIYDDVNFINRGWVNRNQILSNGKAFLFTVPLTSASQNKLINQIQITEDQKGIIKLLKTINDFYKKAPFFNEVYPLIEKILSYSERNISAFIHHSLLCINSYLNITTTIVRTSEIYNNTHLKAQERILDICIREQADCYINPIGGKEIYTRELFETKSIELNFIKSGNIEYNQFKNDFIPFLSIIDVLMFNSVDIVNEYLLKYNLEQ